MFQQEDSEVIFLASLENSQDDTKRWTLKTYTGHVLGNGLTSGRVSLAVQHYCNEYYHDRPHKLAANIFWNEAQTPW